MSAFKLPTGTYIIHSQPSLSSNLSAKCSTQTNSPPSKIEEYETRRKNRRFELQSTDLGRSSFLCSRRAFQSKQRSTDARSKTEALEAKAVMTPSVDEKCAEFEAFQKQAKEGWNLVPIFKRIFADHLTPVLAYRQLIDQSDHTTPSFLLESVVNGDQQGRYSFVGARPSLELIAKGYELKIIRHQRKKVSDSGSLNGVLSEEGSLNNSSNGSNNGASSENGTLNGVETTEEVLHCSDPIKVIQDMSREMRAANGRTVGLPDGFCGGWAGYAGYETVRYVEGESIPFDSAPVDDRKLPDLHMSLFRQVIVFDHVQKLAYVVNWVDLREHDNVEAAFADGAAELRTLVSRLQRVKEQSLHPGTVDLSLSGRRGGIMASNMSKEQFMEAFQACFQHIRQGDVFQIVLSQRFERKTFAEPFEIYRSLRIVNPSPYMIYMQCKGSILVASSPEILTRIHDREITNRPLAGTRPRGSTPEEDVALEKELIADEKDRAEHFMLVDLGRNDVGKVSKLGSVTVPKLLEVERYSHVMHISSTVQGTLLSDLDAWDALKSELPVGTVSGAPKVRAMQIIDAWEKNRRGPYGGAIGVAGFEGNMDMALALRTMVIPCPPAEADSEEERRKWTVHIQAGAGLVWDSVVESEYQETVNKAAGLARAIDLAEDAFL